MPRQLKLNLAWLQIGFSLEVSAIGAKSTVGLSVLQIADTYVSYSAVICTRDLAPSLRSHLAFSFLRRLTVFGIVENSGCANLIQWDILTGMS